jgi:hypothetical protein
LAIAAVRVQVPLRVRNKNRNHLDDKWLRFLFCVVALLYKLESSKNKPVIGVNFVNDGLAILKFFVELRIVTD